MASYESFAAVYDRWSADMTEDVPFYVDLVREADGPVAELAVGTGRVAVPAAAATGKRIVGVDASEAMLAQARREAEAAGVELDLRLGDMRDFELEQPAALVYSPFRSLLHMPTWADKRRVFERVAAALAPGGRFAWNAFCFDPHVAARNDGEWAEQHGVRHRVDHVPAESRIDVTLDDGAQISLWWATKAEWHGLVDVAGLEVEALYGWFDRRPFDDESREFVFVARKPL